MESDLDLALKAIEEIQDFESWEFEFNNIVVDFVLQAEVNLKRLASFGDTLIENQNSEEDYPDILQKVCLNKLKEYRRTIIDQYQSISAKDLEIIQLESENRSLKENNTSLVTKINELKDYLNTADAMNMALRFENAKLLDKLIDLESSVSNIESKSQKLTQDMANEECEKIQSAVGHLQYVISHKNDVIKKLQDEIEEYNLLKKQHEQLQKELSIIGQLKRENNKLEETIAELNRDYQSLVVNMSNKPCECNINTIKDCYINKSAGSTNVSRNNETSDDETHNKNMMPDSHFLMLNKVAKRHVRINSLMDEIISTKNGSLASNSGSNTQIEPKEIQTARDHLSKDSELSLITKKTHRKPFFSQCLKSPGLRNDQEEINSHCNANSIIELPQEDNFTFNRRRSIEINVSELGSDVENEQEKLRKISTESNVGTINELAFEGSDVLEKEKILLNWEESDFPRLLSRTSISLRRQSSRAYTETEEKEKQTGESIENYIVRRRSTLYNNLIMKEMPLIDEEKYGECSTPHIEINKENEVEKKVYRRLGSQENIIKNIELLRKESKLFDIKNTLETQPSDRDCCPENVINNFGNTSDKTVQTESDSVVKQEDNYKEAKWNGVTPLKDLEHPNNFFTPTASQVSTTVSTGLGASKCFNEFNFGNSSFVNPSTFQNNISTQKPACNSENTENGFNNHEEQIDSGPGLLTSIILTIVPMIASSSLTYLIMRKK